MNTIKAYKFLIGVTLALGAVVLLRPDWVLQLYADAAPDTSYPAHGYIPLKATRVTATASSTETFDLSSISFAISTATQAVQKNNEVVAIATTAKDPLKTNRLIIPRMGVDADVLDGPTQATLNKGLWHIPGSAVPGQDGNIVISAHRWLYKPPNPKTFYLIETLKVGDPIYYNYHGSRYTYRVSKTFVVNPDDVHILKQDENKLTLFTCTPLYSTKQRLVVNADLVSIAKL